MSIEILRACTCSGAVAVLRASPLQETAGGVSPPRGTLAQWKLNRILDYIEQHRTERITGEKLASLIGVSVGTLFRGFKLTVGVTPHRYIASRRVALACSLLRDSPARMSEIALAAGYFDQAHFCRAFRRILGTTPSSWRNTNRPVNGLHHSPAHPVPS